MHTDITSQEIQRDDCHRGLFSAMMAEGTKLFFKTGFFSQARVLDLWPDGSANEEPAQI